MAGEHRAPARRRISSATGPFRQAGRLPRGRRDGPGGEGVRPEGGLDPRAHHVEVDPDEGQRLAVDGARRAGRRPAPDGAEYLGLDPLWADALVAQDGTRRLTG